MSAEDLAQPLYAYLDSDASPDWIIAHLPAGEPNVSTRLISSADNFKRGGTIRVSLRGDCVRLLGQAVTVATGQLSC